MIILAGQRRHQSCGAADKGTAGNLSRAKPDVKREATKDFNRTAPVGLEIPINNKAIF